MTHLTIQLAFNFDHTETGLHDAIELLAFSIYNGLALNSLRAYNQIFVAIRHCRESNILPLSICSNLNQRLVAFHNDVLTLNGVR